MQTPPDLNQPQPEGAPLAKKNRYVLIGILIGLSLFFLFRSCNTDTMTQQEYRIAQDSHVDKLHITGKERNLSAFNSDLLSAIAKLKHFRFHFVAVFNPLDDLEQGKLDGIITTLRPSYLYENRFLFSNPFFSSGPVLITPTNEPMNGWNENRKRIMAVSRNSPMLMNLESDPSIQVKHYEDILPALADLRSRRIDGAIFPAYQAYTYTEILYKNEFKIFSTALTNEGLSLTVLKNPSGEALIQEFNDGLEELKRNGTYDELLKRWGFINFETIVKENEKNAADSKNTIDQSSPQ